MNKAVLLPNIDGFPSDSMRRYAAELTAAMQGLRAADWDIEALACSPSRAVAGALGPSMASRHARFLKYPSQIRACRDADIFHILDHSHANLALACPPERTVLTCHDIIPLLAARGLIAMPHPALTRFTFPLRVRCMDRCRKIIAISESTKKTLVEIAGIPAEKIDVVYYGCNPAFSPDPAGCSRADERRDVFARYGIPPQAKVLLHVATPTRYKNSPAIIEALRILKAAPEPDIHLLRVGADFFEDEAALIARLGVGDRIHQAERIGDDRLLAACYRAADVFVFPSLFEGFGWPVLEAMSSGTPVVVSDAASLPEVVGAAGLTVPPRDHQALAAAVLPLLTDPDEHARRSQAVLEQAAKFSWEACARGTLAVYEKVLQGC